MSFEQQKVTAHQDLIKQVTGVRDELRELRRYVRTNPDHLHAALTWTQGPVERLNTLSRLLPLPHATVPGRVVDNVTAALPWTRACPEAMEGYLAGADWELALLISHLEKETPR